VLGALCYGSARGDDDLFPFGPMNQYSFRVDPNGMIRSLWLEVDTTAHTHVRVDLSSALEVGVSRAELEGQLDRIITAPARLQQLAAAWGALHPDRPRLTELTVGQDVVLLRHGRAAGHRRDVFTSWTVP